MEKLFCIKCILDLDNGSRKAELIPNDEGNGRHRILHLEPLRQDEASGVEMDENGGIIENTSGYLLKGDKPLKDWQVGDIVYEEYYPEELDR